VGVGQLNKPRSVAVDAQDNVYVVDMTGRVQKFSPDGTYLLSWQMPQTDLGKPKGMCRDRDGSIIVVEPHYQRLNHYSPEGKLLAQWGERGTNAGQFMMPRAAAVNSRGEILVSEYRDVERVQRFSPGGKKFLDNFGHMGTAPGELNRPEGLCVDAQDRIYVADSCNHRIQIFSIDGKFIRAYGKAGTGKGELSYPYDICIDAAGKQYVCEFGNSRIQVFDANDQPIEIIGGPGGGPGQFGNPWGVALDSRGNLYVADSQNHRVQKFVRKRTAAARLSSESRLAVNRSDITSASEKLYKAAGRSSGRSGMSIEGIWQLNQAPLGAACASEPWIVPMSLLTELKNDILPTAFYKPVAPNGAHAALLLDFSDEKSAAASSQNATYSDSAVRTVLGLFRPRF
jgi:DNA-binding beta-propeller fold protein YncE